jgi:hypothetical protein
MESVELVQINAQGGYGYKMRQISQEGGASEDSSVSGAVLTGEASLGLFGKGQDDDGNRVRGGLTLATAKFDSMVGKAHDNYLRFSLNYGFRWSAEIEANKTRVFYESGLTGRYDYNKVTLPDQTIAGGTHSITVPLGIGVGAYRLMVSDRVELGIGFPASFKMKNVVEVNYRLYGNFENRIINSLDVFANYGLEMGRLTGNATEFSHLFLGGLRANIVDLAIRQ